MYQPKKNSWKGKTKWMLGSFLMLMALGFIILFFIPERLLKKEFTRRFQEATNDGYSLDLDDLSINLFTRSLSLSGFELTSNSKQNKPKRSFDHFSANSISMQKIDFFGLIFRKKLHFRKLIIDEPMFNFNLGDDDFIEDGPYNFLQQLRPVFNKHLRSVKIDEIELTNAGFVNERFLKDQNSVFGTINFNVGVSNFYTDSTIINHGRTYFEADDLFLSIDNYHKLLGDQIHELSIQKIQYSLKNKDVIGNAIKLQPSDSADHSRTQYFVDIPEIVIKSSDLLNILQKDSILIDSLFLDQAVIKVIPQKDAPEMNLKKIKEFDLYQLVEGEIGQVKINHLSMNADKLRIERENEGKTSIQEFNQLHVQLDGFQLDENSYEDPNKILYSDDLFLFIDQYYLLMNDKIHRFDAENIITFSKENFIRADHLSLKPVDTTTELTTVDMQCDSLRLVDVDLKKLFHNREMPLQSILAYQPSVTIEQGIKQDKDTTDTNSLLYHFIGNYIKGIYANVVAFDQGKFVVNTREKENKGGVIASDFNFKLTDFSLDETSAKRSDKLFFATNIDLNFTNYRMKLADQIHRLEIGHVAVSSHNNQASIKNLHLFPDEPEQTRKLLKKYKRSQTYTIKIPYLYLNNTNIHQAFFGKNLRINHFTIIEPSIYFEVFARPGSREKSSNPREFYELLNNYIENIYIGKISAPNGNIQMVTHNRRGKTISFNNKFSVELDHFVLNDTEIEKKKLLFSDHFELKVEDQLFQLSDNVHYLQASEIGVSSRNSEVYIKNAILYPDVTSVTSGELPRHLYVNIPYIKLLGVDLEEAYFNQKLIVDQLDINQARIKFYRTKGHANTNKLSFEKVSVPLPKELQFLSLKQFNLNEGQIRIFITDQLRETEILNADISMTGNNNSLISQGINQPASFKSENIITTLGNLHFTPQKGNVNFKAGKVRFSTKEKNLTINDLLLKNQSKNSTEKFVQLKVPHINFELLNLNEILDNNRIHFESIQADEPELTIKKNREDDQSGPNLYQLKIPGSMSPFINKLSAREIKLNDAKLKLTGENEVKEFKNIYISMHGFDLDTMPSDQILGAQSVNLSLKNYALSDQDRLHNFHIAEINFNNQNNKLSLSGININPRYSKDRYQYVIDHQADHYQGTIERIDFHDLDLKRWYTQHELTGSSVIMDQVNLNIYRDKRTPFNEKQRSKLPRELIKDFELPFYFDTIKLNKSTISYIEQLPDWPSPGKVYFENLNVKAYPVTNLPYLLPTKHTIILEADALLMGQALLETKMTYDMRYPENPFQVRGKLAPFDMTLLNPVTRNMAGIEIRSGQLKRFEFDFEANNTQANGKLRFAYDDLRVSILEQKDGDTRKDKFASFLTNNLVLKSKHPRTRILLPDEIKFERDPKRSVINYWWKSVFSGAKNTFGIKEDNDD